MSQFLEQVTEWDSFSSSALAAENMTDLIICAIVSSAPLFRGTTLLSERKKWPPARL
jgi:hypothetical protein